MSGSFRLILDPPRDGALNMAIDRALLEAAGDANPQPVLRLYRWERPTLTIGHTQSLAAIDAEYLHDNNMPLVRRPTGGRALLHDDEMTYALAIPAGSRLHGSLDTIYRLAEDALREALFVCGINVDEGQTKSSGDLRGAPCCATTRIRRELTLYGAKIAAAAQRRTKSAALQHGSLFLTMDQDRYLSAFRWPDDRQKQKAAPLMGGINQLHEHTLTYDRMAVAFTAAFARLHGVAFEERPLSSAELERAAFFLAETTVLTGRDSKAAVRGVV